MNKKILLSTIACAVALNTNSFAFSDIPENFWANSAINFMEENDIVNGFLEDGTFRPRDFATREQVATILRKFFKIELKKDIKQFDDVTALAWSKEHIDLASQYFYDSSDLKNFRPYDFTTRLEVAEAVLRILGLDLETPDLSCIENFNDYNTFNEREKNIIALVVENGIMKGYADNTFLPNQMITRAEMCSLLHNTFNVKSDLLEKNDDKVVFSIGKDDVTVKEFKLYFNVQKKIYEMLLGSNNIWDRKIQDTILYSLCKDVTMDEIINIKLILAKAEEMGVKLDDETRNKILSQVDTEQFKQMCDYYEITSDELLRILEESEMSRLVAQKVYDTIDHSAHNHADINELREERSYDVRHILILTQNKTPEEIEKAKELAESILIRVKDGEDFSALANEYSEDGGSNKNGGLYENIKEGEFVSEIEDIALNENVGVIYPNLVKTVFGYHIVKPEGRSMEKVQMSEEEKMAIINADFNEVLSNWSNETNLTLVTSVYNRI